MISFHLQLLQEKLEGLDQFLEKNGDPITSQWWGMNSPWPFVFIGINLILLIQVWLPLYMKDRKPKDLKPLMLIINGNAFGGYTIGVLCAIYLADWGFDCFRCQAYDPYTRDLKAVGLKHLSYMLVYTKIYDFLKPIFSVLSGRQHDVTPLQLIHLQAALMFTWFGTKVNPGGVFTMTGLVDTWFQILTSAYLVMTTASPEIIKPSVRIKQYLLTFRFVTAFGTFIHAIYFLLQPNCYTWELRFLNATYIGCYFLFLPLDLHIRSKQKEKFGVELCC